MKNKYHPAIVVVAFNRQHSLERILRSLNQAHYPADTKLVISIDNNGKNENIADFANNFAWKHGKKEVIYHSKRLGLRNHVVSCGDLTYKYGSVIILEDDLFMSPCFYEYALEAMHFYDDDNRIAGTSLYALPYSEASKLPFTPIDDDSDVFFMQMPASLGQVWTEKQWDGFKKWYDTKPDPTAVPAIPTPIYEWPEHSWKRFFVAYVVKFDKYFVFPRYSYSTTFPDPGTNVVTKSYYLQVPLMLRKKELRLKPLNEASNVYDVYSELLPDRLNRFTNLLNDYDYEIDLYGWKEEFNKEFVLTCRACKQPIYSFDRNLKPHEMNIIMNIPGNLLHLVKSENVIKRPKNLDELLEEQTYFFRSIYRTSFLFNILKNRAMKKVIRK